jgi:prevent-host-death family protein
MKAYSILEAQENLANIAKSINKTHKPVCIKNETNSLILLSKADYESLQETLYLYSIPGLIHEINEASKEPIESCKVYNSSDW